MRASEIIGGVSVIGVIALIGFAIADDADSSTITTPTAPTILAPIDSTPEQETTTTAAAETTTTVALESEPSEPPVETDPPQTDPEATVAPTTTTTIPPTPVEQREGVRVRVVNAGGVVGAATFATGVLEGAGFAPVNPGDGVVDVAQNTVLFAPGQNAAAAAVNESINAAPEFVREATPDDPNWVEFGSEVDVLVVIGPA